MGQLSGKCAIVTGASAPQGIGAAIARRFAQAGASVFLVAEATAEQLALLAAQCRGFEDAGRIETALIDVGDPGAAERLVEEAHRIFGRIDILVNNAGVRAPVDFGNYTRAQFDRTIAVNIAAPFFSSQAVLPIMRAQGGGRIIHIASQLGHVTYAQRALYGLTKAALIHLTRSMAYELAAEKIIVNAISPGPIATQATAGRDPELVRQRIAQYLPVGRLGEPEEIADVALYLAAQAPEFLQGQDIVVDGGYTIH
ncbi:MAG: glucose 1-dehydrogenase [Burkholderiaceae bacterium]|nr:glucose 1-dehydrogenase [Burkholderiaceae bacterium]MDO9090490.1 glucose 1-dehydrogenase [Burkholderiaceae bacterium]